MTDILHPTMRPAWKLSNEGTQGPCAGEGQSSSRHQGLSKRSVQLLRAAGYNGGRGGSTLDKRGICEYWLKTAERDYHTMHHLFESEDYHWALFMGHLVIEKLLKAAFSARADAAALPPRSHDLLLLSERAGLETDEARRDVLDTVTTFNISARYPDYKNSFYLKCTPAYARARLDDIEELRAWLLAGLTPLSER